MEEVDLVNLTCFNFKSEPDVKLQLHKAASASDLKKLLEQAKDHDALDENGDTPLHCFVKRKDKGKFNCLMTLLIHSRCNVNLPNKVGQTALHLACQSNDTLVLKALIAFDAKVNVDDKTPLDILLENKASDLDTVRLLINVGAMTHKEVESNRMHNLCSSLAAGHNFRRLYDVGKSAPSMMFLRARLPHRESKGLRMFSSTASPPLASTLETTDGIEDEVDSCPLEEEEEEEDINETELLAFTEKSPPSQSGHQSHSQDKTDSEKKFLKEIEELKKYGSRRHKDTPSHDSEGVEWSQSKVNPEMEVMDSVIGESVVPIFDYQGEIRLPTYQSENRSPEYLRKTGAAGLPEPGDREVRRERCSQWFLTSEVSYQRGHQSMEQERVRSRLTRRVSHRRSPPEYLEDKRQRILFLDGGGIKGLIQIEMLKTIEQMTGKPISELFDWVVGTSTGGILALGMIYGNLSLVDLRRLYFEMKDTVFRKTSKVISHVCDTDALESLLKRMLGTELRMDSIKKPRVLIAAVNKSTTDLPVVFFNNCLEHDNERSVRNELVWKVARYTSAAPVFFAERDNYVDGGVKANNPTSYGLAEILEFLSKKYGLWSEAAKISCVVSLGCGIYPPEPLGNTDIADALKLTKLHNIPDRLKQLLTLLTAALSSSDEIARLCRINCEHQGIAYFRFNPKIGEEVGTTEKDNEKLCQIIIRAKQLFRENAKQVEKMIQQLRCEIREDYLYRETVF